MLLALPFRYRHAINLLVSYTPLAGAGPAGPIGMLVTYMGLGRNGYERLQLQPCVQPRGLIGIVLDPQLRRPMHDSGNWVLS